MGVAPCITRGFLYNSMSLISARPVYLVQEDTIIITAAVTVCETKLTKDYNTKENENCYQNSHLIYII